MLGFRTIVSVALTLLLLGCGPSRQREQVAARMDAPVIAHVRLSENFGVSAFSGRLLILIAKIPPGGRESPYVFLDPDISDPERVRLVAQDVAGLRAGETVSVDLSSPGYPAGAALEPGRYFVQAILDTNRDYAYRKRLSEGDLYSFGGAVEAILPNSPPLLELSLQAPAVSPWPALEATPELPANPTTKAMHDSTRRIEFLSPALSAFHKEPTYIRAWVLLPPGYAESHERYPLVFKLAGFGVTFNELAGPAGVGAIFPRMKSGATPPMAWVFLDHHIPTGTHEFVDSANNGPWGSALADEFIPFLEKQFRIGGTPDTRFLTGTSSGGWSALWLQVSYPEMFGGVWAIAPDPVDFRSFQTVNLHTARNFYGQEGAPAYAVRRDGRPVTTMRDLAQIERVMGARGGQLASFEAVFSPRSGKTGLPQPLFDRDTGVIDRDVAAYWIRQYDLSEKIRVASKPKLAALQNKIHVFVGDADTYYLDSAVALFSGVVAEAGVRADIRIIPGKDHYTIASMRVDDRPLLDFVARQIREAGTASQIH